MKDMKFFLTITEKVVSVNSLYQAGVKYVGRRAVPYLYKNPKALKLESEVLEQLRALDLSEYVDWLEGTKLFTITISFVLKSNITRRDVQNMDKQIIDIVTKYIKEELGVSKFDDSLFSSVHFFKSVIPKAEKEYCCIQISESTDQLRFDKADEPHKFFLGGTCVGRDWRKELIPELRKRKYKFFNPVVPDWTPECKAIEDTEKSEKCDTHLYILTPEMKGVYSVAEVVNSVWSCVSGSRGFVYFGILGTESDWGSAQWKSLEAVLGMVRDIASGSTRVKAGFISEPVKILDL